MQGRCIEEDDGHGDDDNKVQEENILRRPRRGADAITKTAKATANFMVDEDRDDGDGGVGGGGADRCCVVDGDGVGGAC